RRSAPSASRMTSSGRAPVTVVVAAHNEAGNIEACLASVSWADEVIVVENDSSDDTVERARKVGAKVMSPPFKTIGMSRSAAIELASNPWILVVDADERCTPDLARELRHILTVSPRYEA